MYNSNSPRMLIFSGEFLDQMPMTCETKLCSSVTGRLDTRMKLFDRHPLYIRDFAHAFPNSVTTSLTCLTGKTLPSVISAPHVCSSLPSGYIVVTQRSSAKPRQLSPAIGANGPSGEIDRSIVTAEGPTGMRVTCVRVTPNKSTYLPSI